jgi:hypothetical protein
VTRLSGVMLSSRINAVKCLLSGAIFGAFLVSRASAQMLEWIERLGRSDLDSAGSSGFASGPSLECSEWNNFLIPSPAQGGECGRNSFPPQVVSASGHAGLR